MVVALNVGADAEAGVVEGLVFRAPDLAAFEPAEPALDERLGLGVAVAAAAVGDLQLLQARAKASARVGGPVVGAQGQRVALDAVRGEARFDDGEGLLPAAAQVQRPGRYIRSSFVGLAGEELGSAVPDLVLHGRDVQTGFDLLGDKASGVLLPMQCGLPRSRYADRSFRTKRKRGKARMTAAPRAKRESTYSGIAAQRCWIACRQG